MITFNEIKESSGCHFMPIRSIWYIQNQFSLRNFFGGGGGGRRKGAEEGGGGRGGSTPQSNPYPFKCHFWSQRKQFRIPSIVKRYPFYIPCLELGIPFNCCKCTVLTIWIFHKTRTFSWLFHSHEMYLLALLGFFTNRNDRILLPFHIIQLVKSLPFYIPEAWKS